MSHSPSSQNDRVAFIHRETRRLDQQIFQLNEERAERLRTLNDIQPHTISLPAETLSAIFEYACQMPDHPDRHEFHRYVYSMMNSFPSKKYIRQIALGSVSSHWRQVVWSSPRLWVRICLEIGFRGMENKAALLRLFIENSKEVPLSLSLCFSEEFGSGSPCLVHETVDDLLVEALPRVKELYLVNPPRRWHNYTSRLAQLCGCSLDLHRHRDVHFSPDGQIVFPSNAPLHRFSLRGAPQLPSTNIQLPWMAITSLSFISLPTDLSVQVLVQCPNIVKFHCCFPSPQLSSIGQVTLTNTISLKNLNSFYWETYDNPWSYALIRYLHVPSLRMMHCNIINVADSDDHIIQAFFSRLPPTLTTLSLNIMTSDLEYLPNDLNIQKFVLHDCTTGDVRMLFQKLGPATGQEGRVVRPFPRLRVMQLGGDRILDEDTRQEVTRLGTSYSDELVELLEQRLDDFNNSFTFDMQMATFEWSPETEEKLKVLINKGFHISINEHFEPD